MPVTLTDYHAAIRDAVKTTLLAVLGLDVPIEVVDDPEDAGRLTIPVIALACVGPEDRHSEIDTNASDGIGYGVLVALLTAGVTSREQAPGPPDATTFRRLLHVTFHMKRLTGVSQIGWCEVSDSGPIWDEKKPAFQKLTTAMVVAAVGRFPRS